MDSKLRAKLIAGFDAAKVMHDEFMEPSTDMRGQYDIFKAAYAKVKAARKALDKE